MSEATAHAAQQLSDFVDLELARRLEMAEMILPDCEAALRRYGPEDPIAVENIAGAIAFFGGPNYPANQIVRSGSAWRSGSRRAGPGGRFFPQPRCAVDHRAVADGGSVVADHAGGARVRHRRV